MSEPSGAKRFREGNTTPQTSERGNVGEGETEEYIHPHLPHDAFYMSEEQREECGLGNAVYACVADLVHPPGHPQAGEFVFPGERVIVSVTPPAVADRVGPDILTKKKLARRSFQITIHPTTGDMVPSTEDQVFATYDRDEYLNKGKRSTKYHNQQCYEFTKGMIDRELHTDKADGGAFKNFNDSQLTQQKEKTRQWMRNAGDKWPKSMTLQEIEEKEGADRIKDMERRFARGHRSPKPDEYEKFEEHIAKAAEKGAKKASVSYPGSATK